MKLKIEITMDNAAFEQPNAGPEAARILRDLADRMDRYNGHKNWTHWNVSFWLSNDEGLYQLAVDAISRAKKTNCSDPLSAATRHLQLCLSNATPDGARYSFDAVRAALAGMDE